MVWLLEIRMRISRSWLRTQISGCLLLALSAPFMAGAASAQQAINSRPSAETPSPTQSGNDGMNTEPAPTASLPDSPGSLRLQIIADNRFGSGQQPAPQPHQNNTQQQGATQQQSGTQQPVGTAASESVKATGVAASQPAGAAIAPAKQRRTRSILIKVGALVGAGVAIGTVVGLSAASPSRPR
jgi:hypothetical protein